MAFDFKSAVADTSLPTTGFLFGADSQSTANPSIFTAQAVSTTLLELGNIFYDNGKVGIGTASPTTELELIGSFTITGATVTASNPVLNLSQTWNAGAVVFSGILLNVTNTASSASSRLIDLMVGGVTKFRVSPSGTAIADLSVLALTGNIAANSDSGLFTIGSNSDAMLGRDAAASLRLGGSAAASPIAQTLGVQRATGTNVAAAATFTIIGPRATGNATPGDIVIQTGVAGASGTTASTPTTALTIKGETQEAQFAKDIMLTEMTAPSAPAPNSVRIFAQDNGAGKTQLMAIFGSGAAQQITIEP